MRTEIRKRILIMKNENGNQETKISESTMRYVERSRREAEETFQRVGKDLARLVPNLPKVPESVLNTLKDVGDSHRRLEEALKPSEVTLTPMMNVDALKERNVWDRHNEVLATQEALIGIQGELLKEQKSGSKMAKWILGLTALLVVLTVGLLVLTIVLVL
jgi:hypothetical protein